MVFMKRKIIATIGAALLTLAACSSTTDPAAPSSNPPAAGADGKLTVVASFYPLVYLAEQVGGEQVTVTSLTPAGAEAHDLELAPADVAGLEQADAVVYIKGFQPSVDTAVAEVKPAHVLDVASVANLQADDGHDHGGDEGHEHAATATPRPTETGHDHDHEGHDHDHEGHDHGHDHGGLDPHVWLDPTIMSEAAHELSHVLAEADPAHAEQYHANAEKLMEQLQALDKSFHDGLKTCSSRSLVTAHEAFSYLARAYDLQIIGVAGIDPEAETSVARLQEVSKQVKDQGIKTIFAEPGTNKTMQTLADELQVKLGVLDPLEAQVDPAQDYLAVMQANLQALRDGLGCQ
ncbi:zinc ABC transporter substrate-binding protein [Buchananella hordeovulneris]|nr:zinc ABC transporter substrate-binding protein [Buchananella hordeovulneris]